jgi:hypothetical protein
MGSLLSMNRWTKNQLHNVWDFFGFENRKKGRGRLMNFQEDAYLLGLQIMSQKVGEVKFGVWFCEETVLKMSILNDSNPTL